MGSQPGQRQAGRTEQLKPFEMLLGGPDARICSPPECPPTPNPSLQDQEFRPCILATAFPVVDPSTRLALANLRAHLVAEGDFSPKAVDAIALHVATEGTVYDAPYVPPG